MTVKKIFVAELELFWYTYYILVGDLKCIKIRLKKNMIGLSLSMSVNNKIDRLQSKDIKCLVYKWIVVLYKGIPILYVIAG